VPSELEYAEGYKDRINVLKSKMKPLSDSVNVGKIKESYEDPD